MTDVQQLLERSVDGDEAARAQLTPTVYATLREIAARQLQRDNEVAEPLLEPTMLVHEAYLKLLQQTEVPEQSRTHFVATSAVMIRQILIDHLRARRAAKRGGGWQKITLSGGAAVDVPPVDLVEIDEALKELAVRSPRAARIVELRFFGGLTMSQIADELDLSERTVHNEWRFARAWLLTNLSEQPKS